MEKVEKEFSLDLWGTLIAPAPAFATARLQLLVDVCGCREAAARAALKSVKAHYDGLAVQYGVSTPAAQIFQRLAAELGYNGPCKMLMADYYELFQIHAPLLLDHDLPALLATWAARYRLHLISNTLLVPGAVLVSTLNAAYSNCLRVFDSWTFSDEVGYSKPHRRIFAHAYAQMQTPKEAVTHIGNDPQTDFYGAQQFGWQAVLVDYSQGRGLRQIWDALAL